MHDYHTKKISLPSGQTIEIIYLIDSDQADTHPAPSHADGAPATAAPLHYCPECASDLVYPVTWQERSLPFAGGSPQIVGMDSS